MAPYDTPARSRTLRIYSNKHKITPKHSTLDLGKFSSSENLRKAVSITTIDDKTGHVSNPVYRANIPPAFHPTNNENELLYTPSENLLVKRVGQLQSARATTDELQSSVPSKSDDDSSHLSATPGSNLSSERSARKRKHDILGKAGKTPEQQALLDEGLAEMRRRYARKQSMKMNRDFQSYTTKTPTTNSVMDEGSHHDEVDDIRAAAPRFPSVLDELDMDVLNIGEISPNSPSQSHLGWDGGDQNTLGAPNSRCNQDDLDYRHKAPKKHKRVATKHNPSSHSSAKTRRKVPSKRKGKIVRDIPPGGLAIVGERLEDSQPDEGEPLELSQDPISQLSEHLEGSGHVKRKQNYMVKFPQQPRGTLEIDYYDNFRMPQVQALSPKSRQRDKLESIGDGFEGDEARPIGKTLPFRKAHRPSSNVIARNQLPMLTLATHKNFESIVIDDLVYRTPRQTLKKESRIVEENELSPMFLHNESDSGELVTHTATLDQLAELLMPPEATKLSIRRTSTMVSQPQSSLMTPMISSPIKEDQAMVPRRKSVKFAQSPKSDGVPQPHRHGVSQNLPRRELTLSQKLKLSAPVPRPASDEQGAKLSAEEQLRMVVSKKRVSRYDSDSDEEDLYLEESDTETDDGKIDADIDDENDDGELIVQDEQRHRPDEDGKFEEVALINGKNQAEGGSSIHTVGGEPFSCIGIDDEEPSDSHLLEDLAEELQEEGASTYPRKQKTSARELRNDPKEHLLVEVPEVAEVSVSISQILAVKIQSHFDAGADPQNHPSSADTGAKGSYQAGILEPYTPDLKLRELVDRQKSIVSQWGKFYGLEGAEQSVTERPPTISQRTPIPGRDGQATISYANENHDSHCNVFGLAENNSAVEESDWRPRPPKESRVLMEVDDEIVDSPTPMHLRTIKSSERPAATNHCHPLQNRRSSRLQSSMLSLPLTRIRRQSAVLKSPEFAATQTQRSIELGGASQIAIYSQTTEPSISQALGQPGSQQASLRLPSPFIAETQDMGPPQAYHQIQESEELSYSQRTYTPPSSVVYDQVADYFDRSQNIFQQPVLGFRNMQRSKSMFTPSQFKQPTRIGVTMSCSTSMSSGMAQLLSSSSLANLSEGRNSNASSRSMSLLPNRRSGAPVKLDQLARKASQIMGTIPSSSARRRHTSVLGIPHLLTIPAGK
ncbi:hypothetical protein BJ878DRAFT_570641 [Calycina marina]|uniref:Uncharacterized protein n=1 Tax=Calycina marina TaxID=1763456 RepID=A0A9P7YXH0_9HELO|nr:hypothetical protein BJ878DRAFT_570641 [Calycina marina]